MNIFTAVERLASARDLSPDEFLAQAELALEDSSYPSPECLLPGEVSHFRLHGAWPAESKGEIEQHLASCMACRTLVEVSKPDRRREDELVDAATTSSYR